MRAEEITLPFMFNLASFFKMLPGQTSTVITILPYSSKVAALQTNAILTCSKIRNLSPCQLFGQKDQCASALS